MKRLLLVGLGLALFVGTLVLGWNFAAANAATIQIDLLWTTLVEISVWRLVVVSFALGGTIVGATFGFLWLRGWSFVVAIERPFGSWNRSFIRCVVCHSRGRRMRVLLSLAPQILVLRATRPLRALLARGVSSWRLADRKALSTQGKQGLWRRRYGAAFELLLPTSGRRRRPGSSVLSR